jgi:hypothetical protein
MGLIFRHAWLLFIAVTCANGVTWWIRGKKEMAQHPELAAGYRSLIRGWVVYGNIPWVVMGIGILFGGVPSVFDYFNPRNGPFVVAWYVSAVALWIATAYWIFLRGGAEAVVRHPGLLNWPAPRPSGIKALVALSLLSGVVALTMMILGYVPNAR